MAVRRQEAPYLGRERWSRPGTWSRTRVLAALRDWSEHVGDPPRSYEWSPATARAMGLYGPRAALWEARHPRWPSTTTVTRYFGRWSAALEAAGLAPRRAIAPGAERALRVEAAQRMARRGVRAGAIAAALGISPRTVRAYLRAGDCTDCGAPVVTGAARCPRCAARAAAQPRATRDEVIAAIRAWAEETGAPPRLEDWTPAGDPARKWAREHPRWPSYMTARTHFGTWAAALRAAGHEPHRERWTAEAILAALRRFAQDEGRPPTSGELTYGRRRLPALRTVDRHFGSFAAALERAGLAPRRRRWTRDQIAAAIEAFRERHGRLPTSRDWSRSTAEHPHATTVLQHFGSWSAATARVSPRARPPRRRSPP